MQFRGITRAITGFATVLSSAICGILMSCQFLRDKIEQQEQTTIVTMHVLEGVNVENLERRKEVIK